MTRQYRPTTTAPIAVKPTRHQNVGRSAPRPFAVHPSATTRTRKVRRIGEAVTPRDRDAAMLARPALARATREQADVLFGVIAVREARLARITAKVAAADAIVVTRRNARADWMLTRCVTCHGERHPQSVLFCGDGECVTGQRQAFALSIATLNRIDDTRGYCIIGRK